LEWAAPMTGDEPGESKSRKKSTKRRRKVVGRSVSICCQQNGCVGTEDLHVQEEERKQDQGALGGNQDVTYSRLKGGE
jgi:hypothetical protein